jgi:hypothetical protein
MLLKMAAEHDTEGTALLKKVDTATKQFDDFGMHLCAKVLHKVHDTPEVSKEDMGGISAEELASLRIGKERMKEELDAMADQIISVMPDDFVADLVKGLKKEGAPYEEAVLGFKRIPLRDSDEVPMQYASKVVHVLLLTYDAIESLPDSPAPSPIPSVSAHPVLDELLRQKSKEKEMRSLMDEALRDLKSTLNQKTE